jgi:hypothetical protein
VLCSTCNSERVAVNPTWVGGGGGHKAQSAIATIARARQPVDFMTTTQTLVLGVASSCHDTKRAGSGRSQLHPAGVAALL